ncbi:unnamed protein product [Trichogramma brassicae]|uniref:Uncharacterized protein n=1 Tax=Trichogramma brassicae TaxID=86971 RepID=A0A6H5IEE8_9HYME|nr:unnamed protein product [Trichogramma brassicae]
MSSDDEYVDQRKLKELKCLRKYFNLNIEYICQLHFLIKDWTVGLPDLKHVFQKKEIDRLLIESDSFIEFVARTGYKDEPDVDEDGSPVLRRTTAVHHACRDYSRSRLPHVLRTLFQIYSRFDANYIDEYGVTHFQVVCQYNFSVDIVEKFLEAGQDPNSLVQETGDSLLHMALKLGQRRVVEMLLRHGADTNLRNGDGWTSLHLICKKYRDDDDFVETFFKISKEVNRPPQIDAVDNLGWTPLQYALADGCKKRVIQILLEEGADPNSVNDGLTPLHIICKRVEDNESIAMTFLQTNEKRHQIVLVNAQDKLGNTPLHLLMQFARSDIKKTAEILLTHGANPNLINDEGLTPLHVICNLSQTPLRYALPNDCTKQIVQVLLKNGADPNLANDNGSTSLHMLCDKTYDDTLANFEILTIGHQEVLESVLKGGAQPNLANAEGLTPLHIICKRKRNDNLAETFFKVNEEINQLVQIDARDNLGNTALHLALRYDNDKVAEFLLRKGADPNLANEERMTPLHIIGQRCWNYRNDIFLDTFFRITKKSNQQLQVNAVDSIGRTPLHNALADGRNKQIVRFLLREGADLNSSDAEGFTPLHIICQKEDDDGFMKLFFNFIDSQEKTVQVDTQDELGNTPLHLTLQFARSDVKKRVTEILLRRGANPNLANKKGLTLLHIVCQGYNDIDLVTTLFDLSKDEYKPVLVDARDNLGRTPLQFAVASLSPDVVNVLLDHGADLSSFVFPAPSYFAEGLVPGLSERPYDFKLRLASGVLAIVKRLEDGGYELDRNDAVTIMKFFAKCELVEKSKDLKRRWYNNKKFAQKAKKIMLDSNRSLYDLIQLPSEEAAKQLTYTNLYKFAHSSDLYKLPKSHREACAMRLWATVSRRFLLEWVPDAFMELIHKRLPLECCDMIIETLANEDLYHICLAATNQSS